MLREDAPRAGDSPKAVPMNAPASVVEQFVQRARGLYSLPAVAMRVLELTNSPKVDVRALKECIENDPALTTRILRVVNSSLFGLTREVTDLNQALALLGIKPLKMLVLGFSLPKKLFAALEADVLSRYWRHTLTKAVVARELSERYWHQPGEEAFIAGLLQELGQLVLIQDLGEPYVRFAHRVASVGGDLLALELETLGFDHALLSARLLHHWGLPDSLVHAIGIPHCTRTILALPVVERSLPQLLHVAELIARLLTSERPPAIDDLLTTCEAYRRLTVQDLPALLDDLDDKVQQLADVLQLQLADGSDYRSVLIEAHTQLATVAGEAAIDMLQPTDLELEQLSQAVRQVTERHPSPSRCVTVDAASVLPTSAAPRRTVTITADAVWSDPGLAGKLTAAVHHCRQQREPLSLVLADVDHFGDWILTRGADAMFALVGRLEQLLAGELDPGSTCIHLGDEHFALILANSDRQTSAETARQLASRVRRWGQPLVEEAGLALTISMGLASLNVPPKNFPAQDMIVSARRCLAGAQLSGGDTVKSIELS
jgi:HD-like signal output (HDOD) protein/GGDEF domain-containing protein